MKSPTIFVEIPHQRSPRVRIVDSRDELEALAWAAAGDNWTEPMDTEDDLIHALGHDLNALIVIEDQEDYDHAVLPDPHRGDGGHQYASYIGDLREAGRDLGYEQEDEPDNIQ